MKEINKKMIDQAFNEFKDFKFKIKLLIALSMKLLVKEKALKYVMENYN